MSNIENIGELWENLYMFIIDCLPFRKGLNKDSLSYFSSTFLKPGSLIKVTIRNKSVRALVLESRSVREVKSEIKSADFQLKKVSSFTSKPFLQKEFLGTIKESATYFAVSEGSILSHLIPSFILENPNLLSILKEPTENLPAEINKKNQQGVFVLQAEDEERYLHYRSLIREEFAKKKSVFICLPKNEDVKYMKEKLERGIESYVSVFHQDMTKKDLKEEWKRAYLTEHPMLFISTTRWLFLPREDVGTIILDKENENGWKTFSRPFIDLRFFAEKLAGNKNIRCILGDEFLRVETLYRRDQKEVEDFERPKWRIISEAKTQLIDLRESTKKEKEFKALSQETIDMIKETVDKGSHMFLFAARKGLSPITLCRDCGNPVKCDNCSSPMVLYKTKTGGAFKCHQCEETRDAAEVCQYCKSWKLAAFGSGMDRVAEEIKEVVAPHHLFEINKDIASSNSKATNIIKRFYESKGSILLGTEIAFSYLHKKVRSTAIASFDSLFSVPDFRIREKIFHIILQTQDLAREKCLIQTRNPTDPTIEFGLQGDLLEFYKKEMEDRRVLAYPPLSTFIKITVRGTRGFVGKEAQNLARLLPGATLFPSIHEKHGEQAAANAVLKMPREEWPNPSLLHTMKTLPPHFEVKVDPDNLL